MNLRITLKNTLRRFDKKLPSPIFYEFAMSVDEQALFDETIKKSKNYLEFGMGGSTLRAIQRSLATIHAVESSASWVEHMRGYRILRQAERTRLRIIPVDIGATGAWGYPTSNMKIESYPDYSSIAFDAVDPRTLDLILVDGRFRVACTLKALLSCHDNAGLRILIHDFWNRPQYHSLLEHLDTLKRVNTLGLFKPKENLEISHIEACYNRFCCDPK